jgi:ABC-type hemin transport system ATPase subunit
VLDRLAKQVRKEAKAIVCVLHDPRQIERFADRVIELSYGSPEICLIRTNQGPSS